MTIRQGNDNLRHYSNRFIKTMIDVIYLETNIAIHAYVRGLLPNSLLDDNHTIYNLRILPELFSWAMLYIDVEELWESKKYGDSQWNKKSCLDKKRYTDREATLESSQRYANKKTMLEPPRNMETEAQQQSVLNFKGHKNFCPPTLPWYKMWTAAHKCRPMHGFIHLIISKAILFDKMKR